MGRAEGLVVGNVLGAGDGLADGAGDGRLVDGHAVGKDVGHGDGALDGIFVGAGVGLHVVAGTHAQLQCTSVRCMPPGQCSPHFQPMCPFIWFPLVRSM